MIHPRPARPGPAPRRGDSARSGRVGDRGPGCADDPRSGRAARPGAGDDGAVTVEAALALTVLVLVLAAALAAVACLIGQLRCVDAAREAARLAARDDEAAAVAVVQAAAPDGAELQLGRDAGLVTATVTSRAAGGLLPGVTLTATAVAAREPQAGAT